MIQLRRGAGTSIPRGLTRYSQRNCSAGPDANAAEVETVMKRARRMKLATRRIGRTTFMILFPSTKVSRRARSRISVVSPTEKRSGPEGQIAMTRTRRSEYRSKRRFSSGSATRGERGEQKYFSSLGGGDIITADQTGILSRCYGGFVRRRSH